MWQAVILFFLLCSSAQAACQLGTPMSTSSDYYDYQEEVVQAFTVPVQCDSGEHPILTFSSPGGTLDTLRHRYLGVMSAVNGDQLQYLHS